MKNGKRILALLLTLVLILGVLPAISLAADAEAKPEVNFTGSDVSYYDASSLGARNYAVVATAELNTVNAALELDGNAITEGVAWSLGTNQVSAEIDPATGVISIPAYEKTTKGYLQVNAIYKENTYTRWIHVFGSSLSVTYQRGYTVGEDGSYTHTLDANGKAFDGSTEPYMGFGELGQFQLLDFSFSVPDIVKTRYSAGTAVYVTPQKPGDTVMTVSIKNHPEYKLDITIHVKGVRVTDSNGTGEVLSVFKGEKLNLTAFDGTEDATYTWTTSNKTVATVKNGIVTGWKEGYAVISAKNAGGLQGSVRVYVYENSEKPYLDNLVFSGKTRRQDENGDWLNEQEGSTNGTIEFSRTRWNYGLYYSMGNGQSFSATPTFDEEEYVLSYYVDGEKQADVASGETVKVVLSAGETDVGFRLCSKEDENCFTEYYVHIWVDYSTNASFATLYVTPVGRKTSQTATFTLENALRTGYFYSEGTAYNVATNGKIRTETVQNTYTPWYGASGVLNSYLFSDIEKFTVTTSSAYTKHIAYSSDCPWTTPENKDELPEGWHLYDADNVTNVPEFTWVADEGQDYMTIYLHSVSDQYFLEEGWQAEPTSTAATVTNVSNRELHVYRLPFKENDVQFTELQLSEGSFMSPAFFSGASSATAVIPADCTAVTVKAKPTEGAQIYKTYALNSSDLLPVDEDGYVTREIVTTNDSTTASLWAVLSVPANETFSYSLRKSVVLQFDKKGDTAGLPDAVVDFVSPGSQYTNGRQTAFTGGRMYGIYPERTLLGSTAWTNVTSLGSYGGYITWYFKDAIQDDPKHTYGVDFQVFGNSYANGDGGYGAGEAGQVWVSEDGTNWYALAGSEHFEDDVIWDYQFTYKNINSSNGYDWNDNLGNSGTYFNGSVGAEYPNPTMYPLHDYGENEDEITLGGVLIPWRVHWDMFGYVDSLSSSASYGSGGAGAGDDISGTLENPYARTGYASGYDLSWAVDAEGNPVTFENGIHYVKVQTAVYQAETGIMGELSTEVCTALRTVAQEEEVGQTAGAKSIVISDGDEELTLTASDFTKVSDTVYETDVDAGQMRNLSFTVNAAEDDHIIVNNRSTTSGVAAQNTYAVSADKSRTVRVIVQNGTREPISYFLHITGSAVVSEAVAAVENAIRAIGSVGQDSGEAIRKARALYDALSDAEKASVSNYAVLVAAEEEYAELINASIGASDELITVTVAVEKFTLGQDYILEPTLVTIPKDTTTAQLLVALLGNSKMQYNGTPTASFYLSALADEAEEVDIPEEIVERAGKDLTNTRESDAWLSEFDYATTAGWMYSVNGSFPTEYASECVMQDGDVIRWQFTVVGIGADVGDENSDDPMPVAKKDALTKLVSQVNALEQAEAFIEANAEVYRNAVLTLIDWAAEQDAVDAACAALQAALNAALESDTYGKVSALNIAADRAIAKVIALIDALPEQVTLADQEAVAAARAAYDKLPENLQSYVTNYAALEAAEARLAELAVPEELPFTDLTQDWYKDSVRFVYENGLMVGTSDTTFGPDDALTRGMFVTMLYRMQGEPEVNGSCTFSDVAAGMYYEDAIIWANDNGVVYGENGKFSPNAEITREQMAAMMRRYAEFCEMDTTARADLSVYTDGSTVSSWFTEDMQWAVAAELLYGDNHSQLNPTKNATRAEAAAILQRFAQKLAD